MTKFTSLKVVGGFVLGGAMTIAGTLVSNDSATFTTVYSSGGLLPVAADILQTNFVDGGGASVNDGWSVQNPYSEPVLCTSVSLNVTTAASAAATTIRAYRGSGTVAQSTPGNNIIQSAVLDAVTINGSGSLLYDGNQVTGQTASVLDFPKAFVLDANGGTNDYINVRVTSGTGNNLVSKLHARCYSLD